VEDIDWQGLRDRYVSNIGSQIAYGQLAASQYLSSYFSNIDPRNPGTGSTLDGQKLPVRRRQIRDSLLSFNYNVITAA